MLENGNGDHHFVVAVFFYRDYTTFVCATEHVSHGYSLEKISRYFRKVSIVNIIFFISQLVA